MEYRVQESLEKKKKKDSIEIEIESIRIGELFECNINGTGNTKEIYPKHTRAHEYTAQSILVIVFYQYGGLDLNPPFDLISFICLPFRLPYIREYIAKEIKWK